MQRKISYSGPIKAGEFQLGMMDALEKCASNPQAGIKRILQTEFGEGSIPFILERIKKIEDSSISKLLDTEHEDCDMSTLLVFETSSFQLINSLESLDDAKFSSLMQCLIRMGQKLEENFEHHPSITSNSIFCQNQRYFVMNPYAYSSHIRESLAKKSLFSQSGQPGGWSTSQSTTAALGESKRNISLGYSQSKIGIGSNELEKATKSNNDRLQTNMFQIGVVLLAAGTKQSETDIKTGLKSGRLDMLIKVRTAIGDSLGTRK